MDKWKRGKLLLAMAIMILPFVKMQVQADEVQQIMESGKEYAFYASDYEQACEIVQRYQAELVGYAYGVGTLRLPDGTDSMRTFQITDTEQVTLYPQNWYYTDSELQNVDAYADGYGYIMEQWHLDALHMSEVWQYSKGKGVTVAVIDSGIDTAHEDLQNTLVEAMTVIPDSMYGSTFPEGYKGPADYVGHGTHVAGIIAAEDNNQGVIGIAPESRIISIKALDLKDGVGQGATSWVVAAINAAIEKKADIINMSVAGSKVVDSMLQEAIQRANQEGIVVVCAAGNIPANKPVVYYPAAYPETIAVGALKQGESGMTIDLSYSNYGSFLDISAPGTDIMSTVPKGYGRKRGTSMACPIVSGSIALLLSQKPDLTNDQIKQLLFESADDMGEVGKDDHYGYGSLNMVALMEKYADKYLKLEPVYEIPSGNYVQAGYGIPVTTAEPQAQIRYTLDGTEPDGNSPVVVNGRIVLPNISRMEKMVVTCKTFCGDGRISPAVSAEYRCVPDVYKLESAEGQRVQMAIPAYGTVQDSRTGFYGNCWQIQIEPGYTIALSVDGAGFSYQYAIYDSQEKDAGCLVIGNVNQPCKWKNKEKEAKTVFVYLLENSGKIPIKALEYVMRYSVKKEMAGAIRDGVDITQQEHEEETYEQKQRNENPVVTLFPEQVDMLYTMEPDHNASDSVGKDIVAAGEMTDMHTEEVPEKADMIATGETEESEKSLETAEQNAADPGEEDSGVVEKKKEKTKAGWYVLSGVLIIAAAGFGVWYSVQRSKKKESSEKES